MRTGGGILYPHRAARHAARVEHGRAARGSPGGVVVAAEAVLSAAAAAVSNTAHLSAAVPHSAAVLTVRRLLSHTVALWPRPQMSESSLWLRSSSL